MNRFIVITILLWINLTNCGRSNDTIDSNTHNKVTTLTEDSVIKVVKTLEMSNPDTFIFLNYWYGMPEEYIQILNLINAKNGDLQTYSQYSYGDLAPDTSEETYLILQTQPELMLKLKFVCSSEEHALQQIEIEHEWANVAKYERVMINGNVSSRRIYDYERDKKITSEIDEFYSYLIEIFGQKYDNSITNENYLPEYKIDGEKIKESHITNGSLLDNTILVNIYPPFRKYSWTKPNRIIYSVCNQANEFYERDHLKNKIIGKYFKAKLLFTSISHFNYTKERRESYERLQKKKSIEEKLKQKERL